MEISRTRFRELFKFLHVNFWKSWEESQMKGNFEFPVRSLENFVFREIDIPFSGGKFWKCKLEFFCPIESAL